MAANTLEQALGVVRDTAQSAVDYQPTEWDLAEAAYIKEQEARVANLGKGAEAIIPTFPPPEPVAVPELPTLVYEAEPDPIPEPQPQPQPVTLEQILEPEQPRTLTPCDLGMCEGLSYGTNGNYTVANSAPTGKFLMNSGHAGGRNLLGQMLVAGDLERAGATVEALERNNQRTELADLNQMRRTPEWNQQYEQLAAQGMNRQAAAAHADRLTGNQLGGDYSSITNRYADPVNQARLQAISDQQQARIAAAGAVDQLGSANTSLSGSYQVDGPSNVLRRDDGDYEYSQNVGGQLIQSAPISPNALMGVLTGAGSANTSLAQVNALVNARNTADQAIVKAQNDSAYNQARLQETANQNAIKNQNTLTDQQIRLYNALKPTGGAAKAASATTGVPKRYADIPKEAKPLEGIALEEQEIRNDTLKGYGLNETDGTYPDAQIAKMGNTYGAESAKSYNQALRINKMDVNLWDNPSRVAEALVTVQRGINHAQAMRNNMVRRGLPDTHSNIVYKEFGDRLNQLMELQAELKGRFDKQAQAAQQSSVGLSLGG